MALNLTWRVKRWRRNTSFRYASGPTMFAGELSTRRTIDCVMLALDARHRRSSAIYMSHNYTIRYDSLAFLFSAIAFAT
jgi:hypothetical protein